MLPSYSKDFDVCRYSIRNNKSKENQKLKIKQGKDFLYSNLGYIVLGYIIETVTGENIEEVFKRNIFDKVGMNNTAFKNNVISNNNLAIGYKDYQYTLADINTYDKEVGPRGSGGLCSTVLDINKYMNVLLTDKLISKDMLKLMFTPYKNNYGYGWYTYDQYIEHYGTTFGFRSYIVNRFSDNLKIMILSNVQSCDMRSIVKSLKNKINLT